MGIYFGPFPTLALPRTLEKKNLQTRRLQISLFLGGSHTRSFQTWLFASFFYAFALFCALLRSFALFCALLHSFALFCALLRSFALFCGLAFALICAYLRVSASDRRTWELFFPIFSSEEVSGPISGAVFSPFRARGARFIFTRSAVSSTFMVHQNLAIFGHFLRGRSLKGRCNIRVYVPVCVCVCSCVCPSALPLTPPILWA